MKKGTSPSALSDSFCRIPSANAVSADASAAMNSHILFRVPTKQCPGICTGRCTPHSTFLIERTNNITVSTGFYLLPKDMDSTLPEMLAHADAMLYEEKQKRDKNVAKILPK
jgi:GGDEF domain-containing protein